MLTTEDSPARRGFTRVSMARTTLLTTLLIGAATAQSKRAAPLEKRLAELERRIESERKALRIPGVALAVVHEDRVVLARGFGHADLETKRRVTADTLFAIGSTSKAVTATLAGMLADDGKLSWDDPVTKHVPEFRVRVESDGNAVALRDLLCHRTGYTRMGLLWASARLPRKGIYECVARAEPFGGLREKFLYSNIMFMVAGHALGNAAQSSWPELVATRIFAPLGMKSSSTSITQAQKSENLAKGYVLADDGESFDHLPMRNLDLIGPAGSINSSVRDMACWVRFQLGRGTFAGKRLLSAKAHAETWQPQISVGDGVRYGLGWMLRKWNGKRVVEHGGNIDGFSAQVSLLPDDNLGYVLLTNVTATPLQQKSIDVVFGTLTGNRASTADVAAAADVDSDTLLGSYVANFASFRDARIKVVRQNGKLAVDVPQQRVFELKPPDEQGRYEFAATDQVAVTFQKNEKGDPIGLTMHQSGMNFECPREGIEPSIEVPLEKMQPLLGSYRDPKSGRRLNVSIVQNWLMLDEQRGGRFPLAPPDENGTWSLRANRKRLQIRFDLDDDGRVQALTRIQKGRETRMPRVQAESLPSVDELIAKMRKAYGANALGKLGQVHMSGNVTFANQGVRGKVEQRIAAHGRLASTIDLGKIGSIQTVLNGKRGWLDSTFSPSSELHGARLFQMRYRHPLWPLENWRADYESAAVIGSAKVDGEAVYLLRLLGKDVPNRTVAISKKRGLILMEKTAELAPGPMRFPVTYRYSDYRAVRGVMFAFKTVSKATPTGRIAVQFDDFRGEEPSDAAFRSPIERR